MFSLPQTGYKEKDTVLLDQERSDKETKSERSKSPLSFPKGKKRKANGTGSSSEDSNDGVGMWCKSLSR